MSGKRGDEAVNPLFETRAARGGAAHKLFCLTILCGIVLIWSYRLIHIPRAGQPGKHAWAAMFFAEVLFGLYWIITQSGRWRVVYRYPFKDRLSTRYEDKKLPGFDVFVCTADPILEPPLMVISTVLSVMAYNYPSEKISVYLSDDGGSELTFYALFEASKFSKYWIPFCKKYNVELRSPEVYFSCQNTSVDESSFVQDWTSVKELYEDMKSRIDSAAAKGCIPEEIRDQHKGFSEWNSKVKKHDHQSIVQILIDGWNPEATDIEGNRMPTLVYLSREKRPGWPHNFKAGSMNSLIRVSAEISNAPIILNVDCDMYSNDGDAIRDALCFFLDEKQGQQISYVQYPQNYNNTVKNDVYANLNLAINQIEFCGLDGFGGALYVGTGCFHRRESLSGNKYSGSHRIESHSVIDNTKGRSVQELEEASKILANCSYEKGTQWGKEMGLIYGCPVEDIVTGLAIQCRGWKPVYYNPSKYAFQGVAPTTLDISLIQFKRWSGGMFQVFFSKYCPFIYGHRKISLGAQMGYGIYLLWAPVSLPTLCYAVVPALSLLCDIPLFPQVPSLWFIPFAYVFAAKTAYTLVEDLVLGLSQTAFAVTAKVVDDEAQKRYRKGLIDFGNSSIMLVIIATIALLNLFSLAWGIKKTLFSAPETFEKLMRFSVTTVAVMVILSSFGGAFGVRFVINREECFSHKVEYGNTVHFSFVVIKSEGSWHYSEDGVDLVVKGPNGEQIHDIRDKTSDKHEFVAYHQGVYRFCFTNKSPYHETLDFDVHAGHFLYHDEHAKDEHFKPLFEHIGKLEEALYNIQFEQHWLEAQTDRQAIVNEKMSRGAIHKALFESAALILASGLQVYILRRLFERKLGASRV
ncbi:UNVERIFIED_CONTAM: Cellulose synthase-like protein E6 [Sesamum angustifolium]|uniref:Cellulose synthase-like protein E6 n=1 Tax=Sesamum angustifolium TaxID=2727405 RepID=A0AAW2PEF1_9LAMI